MLLDAALVDNGMLERGSDDLTALDGAEEADATDAEDVAEVRTVVKVMSEVGGRNPDWEEA